MASISLVIHTDIGGLLHRCRGLLEKGYTLDGPEDELELQAVIAELDEVLHAMDGIEPRKASQLQRDIAAAIEQFDGIADVEEGKATGNPLSLMDEPMLNLVGNVDWRGVASLLRKVRGT